MKTAAAINRFLLPGLAFKAVVIGGGYATGRELVEFFMPLGPIGGLYAMAAATLLWSAVCALTFLFAWRIGAIDYRSFFAGLLGRFAPLFELVYFGSLILVLSVFASAAGAIGTSLFGWPTLAGTLLLTGSVMLVCMAGQGAAEAVFKYVSILLYTVYAIFLVMSLSRFGPAIGEGMARQGPMDGWLIGGVTYAGYNVIGAALILPVLRHLRSGSDAVISGLLAGPLAMLPAILFYLCLIAFYPAMLNEPLPSDVVLKALGSPIFHIVFQTMVFFALLECSVGFVQAFSARLDAHNEARGRQTPFAVRLAVLGTIILGSVFAASAIGLIALIAQGYRMMAYAVLIIYVLPLTTIGLIKLARQRNGPGEPSAAVG